LNSFEAYEIELANAINKIASVKNMIYEEKYNLKFDVNV